MIKVQLEFFSVPEAIIALNAIMNLPEVKVTAPAAAVDKTRKGRADKGQKRGEYKPRTEPATPGPAAAQAQEAQRAEPPVQAVAAPASPAPTVSPADTVKNEVLAQQRAHAPTIGDRDAEAQAAIEKAFNKKGIGGVRDLLSAFHVSRVREVPTAQRAAFLKRAAELAA